MSRVLSFERQRLRSRALIIGSLLYCIAAFLASCAKPELPLQLSIRYRFLDELRRGTRPHLEQEHRLELLAELRPSSRQRLRWGGAGGLLGCDHCDEEFVERLYEEWLLRYGDDYADEAELDEESISFTEFERMLEDGELEEEIEVLVEELFDDPTLADEPLEHEEDALRAEDESESRSGVNWAAADDDYGHDEEAEE